MSTIKNIYENKHISMIYSVSTKTGNKMLPYTEIPELNLFPEVKLPCVQLMTEIGKFNIR